MTDGTIGLVSNARHDLDRIDALRFALLAILAFAVVAPQLALAVEAISNPDIRAILANRPLVAAELAIALAFWCALFGWPLARCARCLNKRGTVTIFENLVACEPRQRGHEGWLQPLSTYSGVAHSVRSTYSGVEHAIVLEHRDPARSVSLLVAEHICENDVARVATALNLPRIPSDRPGTLLKFKGKPVIAGTLAAPLPA